MDEHFIHKYRYPKNSQFNCNHNCQSHSFPVDFKENVTKEVNFPDFAGEALEYVIRWVSMDYLLNGPDVTSKNRIIFQFELPGDMVMVTIIFISRVDSLLGNTLDWLFPSD